MAFEGNGIVPVMDMNRGGYGYGDGCGWGGGMWFAWIFVIFALMGGWGGNWGNRGGLAEGQLLQEINAQGNATRDAVRQSFDTNILESGIRGIQNGLCDGFYAVNNSMKDTQGLIQQGLCGLEKTVMQGNYATGAAIAENRFSQERCCCDTNRNLDSVKYENAMNTRAIIDAENCNTQKVLDKLCQMEANAKDQRIADLQFRLQKADNQLQTANFQLSQQAQSANIIGTLRPFPQPAYITCSPYQAANINAYGNCGGCGCAV